MARRQRPDAISPFGQRTFRLIWPMRRAVEQHAADTFAADVFGGQHEYVLAFDFVPAGSLQYRHAGRRLRA